jgi:NhaA family Na+:H+ antiporter
VAFSWLGVRLGFARLPAGARWAHIVGVGALAGIGFTVSLFITALAFDSATLQDDAKTATLAASVVAATIGALTLRAITNNRPDPARPEPTPARSPAGERGS